MSRITHDEVTGVTMKVLIAENNRKTLEYLEQIFLKEGFEPALAENGNQALEAYKMEKPDFICLDIMMPDMDGYEVCKAIRKIDPKTPVVFISAKDQPFDKITGLSLGADDYITKPFNIGEVIARIRAVARRCISAEKPDKLDASFQMDDVLVFPNQLRAQRGEQEIELSLRDIKILQLLYDKQNELISRDALLDSCWGPHIMPESRTLDWHISQLRKKIELDPKAPRIIRTVHGAGYRYEA